MKFKIKHLALALFVLIILVTAWDIIRISTYNEIKSLPENRIEQKINDIYFQLDNGITNIDWKGLDPTFEYINKQYDVADFRMATLVRIVYDFSHAIPDPVKRKIENTFFNFRYWMDEPGENGMCYWSENHQILFASSEYLVGQLYPDSIFHNSGLTGREHMGKARIRILDWLEMRWKFGFSEFYSNVYYSEDIGGMINLIDYSNDEEIAEKTKIIMDLMMYDVATQKTGNMFLSVSGRAYEKSRKGGSKASFKNITNFLWNPSIPPKPHLNYGFITSKKYKTPQVLLEIGNDKTPVVIKQSNGINLSELKKENYYGSDERSIMMQWAMGGYSNHEIIRNSLDYIRKRNLFSNEFLHPFKNLDLTILRYTHLDQLFADFFEPQTDGFAIQRANTYTYRTKDYSLYTVQNYFPGTPSAQMHVTGMNIGESFSVFHTHPSLPDSVKYHSPNYWVGYGYLPHSVQEKNLSISVYNIPNSKSLLEMELLNFTHAYFPTEMFDTVMIKNNYAFGKKDSTFVAMIGRNELFLKEGTTDDIIQKGNNIFWIIEAGSVNEHYSFENFCYKILNNKISFDEENMTLEYITINKKYTLKYNSRFLVNGKRINTNYDRFDSPYIKATRKPDRMIFRYKNRFLHLEFDKQKREFN